MVERWLLLSHHCGSFDAHQGTRERCHGQALSLHFAYWNEYSRQTLNVVYNKHPVIWEYARRTTFTIKVISERFVNIGEESIEGFHLEYQHGFNDLRVFFWIASCDFCHTSQSVPTDLSTHAAHSAHHYAWDSAKEQLYLVYVEMWFKHTMASSRPVSTDSGLALLCCLRLTYT